MNRTLLLRFAIIAVLQGTASILPAADTFYTPEQTRAILEDLAAKTPFLSGDSVIFDRPSLFFKVANEADKKSHDAALVEIANPKHSVKSLLELLNHRDAKVRTLALSALFAKEDPATLPAIAKLADDKAPTFDSHPKLADDRFAPGKEQTVGQFARCMVNFYMDVSGSHYSADEFKAYWDARKTCPYCATWFAMQLDRARQGQEPMDPSRLGRVQAVRKRIDALPLDDRVWTLLWFYADSGKPSDQFVSEKELVQACQQLGSEKLLQMLEGKVDSQDPDLRDHVYGHGHTFVTKHATELLKPTDAERLLRIGSKRHDPAFAVAAAVLQPERAATFLHKAFKEFRDENEFRDSAPYHREYLSEAIWRLVGESETDFLVDWFFNEKPELQWSPNPRSRFIREITGAGKRSPKPLFAKIIKDDRFANLEWQSFEEIVLVVNSWPKVPIIPREELSRVRLYAHDEFNRQVEQGEPDNPKETPKLREEMKKWQNSLRERMPDWIGETQSSEAPKPGRG